MHIHMYLDTDVCGLFVLYTSLRLFIYEKKAKQINKVLSRYIFASFLV